MHYRKVEQTDSRGPQLLFPSVECVLQPPGLPSGLLLEVGQVFFESIVGVSVELDLTLELPDCGGDVGEVGLELL